jgi:rhodanese-related sulfurtransferase
MFTGDTLFCGDVGRPDLIGSKGFSSEEMGAMLYDSLREKILTYPDETEIYPAHGAGSLCGKSLSSETWSTLGAQKATNYALKPMSQEEFVKIVASDQPQVPAYFPKSAERNLAGPMSVDDLPRPVKLSAKEIADFGGVVMDVRSAAEFGAGHIPNAINIGLSGKFATWAGTFVPVGTPLAIVANTVDQVDEAFVRLARVGLESVTGFALMSEYDGSSELIDQTTVNDTSRFLDSADDFQLIDVRLPGEYRAAHAIGAINIPLNTLPDNIDKLDPEKPTYVVCQSGYRSSLATSILENAGFKSLHNVAGGTTAWLEAGLPSESAACSSQTA